MILSNQTKFSTESVIESLSIANEHYRQQQSFLTRLAGSMADVQHHLQIHNASRSIDNQNLLIAATQRLNALLESGGN